MDMFPSKNHQYVLMPSFSSLSYILPTHYDYLQREFPHFHSLTALMGLVRSFWKELAKGTTKRANDSVVANLIGQTYHN